MPEHVITVQKLTATAVAEHYNLDARKLRRWMRRNANVSLLGTIESPAIKQQVERFLTAGVLTDTELREQYLADPSNTHLENEYRGRGLAKKDTVVGKVAGNKTMHLLRAVGKYPSGGTRYAKMCSTNGRANHEPHPVAGGAEVTCKRCLARMN